MKKKRRKDIYIDIALRPAPSRAHGACVREEELRELRIAVSRVKLLISATLAGNLKGGRGNRDIHREDTQGVDGAECDSSDDWETWGVRAGPTVR